MTVIHGFPPLARTDARVLVLGSMPSRESLARQQYYAHPRNAFWPIMTRLFGLREPSYRERAQELTGHGVAVWDVLQACTRSSSLDSDIDDSSIVTNDFTAFLREHSAVRQIFFNGIKAESVYVKQVLPKLPPESAALTRHRLPSTSPANAGMSFQQKLKAWEAVAATGLE